MRHSKFRIKQFFLPVSLSRLSSAESPDSERHCVFKLQMGLLAHIGLLLWKHLVVMRRSKLRALGELVVPLLLLPVFVLLVKFDTNEIINGRSFGSIQLYGGKDDVGNFARDYKECFAGETLAFSCKDAKSQTDAELLLKQVLARYQITEPPTRFDSLVDMENALVADLNGTETRRYIGGVHFTALSKAPGESQLDYRILLPRFKNYDNFISKLFDYWQKRGPYSGDYSDIVDMPFLYWDTGFASLQLAVETEFLGQVTRQLPDVDFSVQQMPTPDTRFSQVINLFLSGVLLQLFWLLVVVVLTSQLVKDIALEKEAGIKTYMAVMGLSPTAFYASHGLVGSAKVLLSLVPISAVLSAGFYSISASVFIVLSFFYGISCLSLAILLATLIKRATLLQSVTSIALGALFGLHCYASPNIDWVVRSALLSLNPIAAFGQAVKTLCLYEIQQRPFGWLDLFANSGNQFTVGLAILLLLFDTVLFWVLACYFDAVLPTDDSVSRHPLFFLGAFGIGDKFSDVAKVAPAEVAPAENSADFEPEGNGADQADIIVQRMSKQWSGSSQLAVDSLSFRALRGQLTVLLGHNGAGKSTTFSVLTGSVSPTEGRVLICGYDLKRDLRKCQQSMGYCPQYNPLFERLTTREHLEFYAGLKSGKWNGPLGKSSLRMEIDAYARDLGILAMLDKEAGKLSGGQKRKLCVAMALISDSSVVLLDEPSTGMDPTARHEMGKLLEREKSNRTILLTTHYMDEADTLGDRIAIMAKGRLVCNGSPEFLKKRFGTGYVLTLVLGNGSPSNSVQNEFAGSVARILATIRKYSPLAYIDNGVQSPPEFDVILPMDDKRYYADLFEELERAQAEMGISSFGVSLNSLEQVFLKVGELAEPEAEAEKADGENKAQKYVRELFGAQQQLGIQPGRLVVCQLLSLVYRHFLWTKRSPIRSLTPVFIALVALLAIGVFLSPERAMKKGHGFPQRQLSPIYNTENIEIALYSIKDQEKTEEWLRQLARRVPHASTVRLDAGQELQSELAERMYDVPPVAFGAALRRNESSQRVVFEAVSNGMALHSMPTALSMLTNALLGSNDNFAIRPSIEIYQVTEDDSSQLAQLHDAGTFLMVTAIVTVALSIFAATNVMPLVEERSGRFKHQLLLTKLNAPTYWAFVVLWNALFYALFCILLGVLISIFGWLQEFAADFYLLWALYFWAFVPMNCCVSFLFDRSQKAYNALVALNLLASLSTPIVVLILKGIFDLKQWNMAILHVIECTMIAFVPACGLGSGAYIMNVVKDLTMEAITKQSALEYLRNPMVGMCVSGLFYWLLLALLQSRTVRTKFHQMGNRKQQPLETGNEDEDVREERTRMEQHGAGGLGLECTLAVRGLCKFYGKNPAVRNLSFGVRPDECFGLLGVNGAGKTTTFDMLTGTQFPSAGCATIAGVDVAESPAIGYCPQFDALPLELSGREVLTLMARLNGFADVKTRVQRILWCIRLEGHADKLVRQYSGGQRRRISIGLTLLARASLIMLDEPTAGIDPKTRREIWNLLQAIRQQRIAMLLTSHSMEECEALCTRIGFMNRGSLIGVGSTQHLKSRFGQSHTLSITVQNPCQKVLEYLQTLVVRKFDAMPTQDPVWSTVLHWELPKKRGVTLSQLFRQALSLADSYQAVQKDPIIPPKGDVPIITDFSLTQNSLEQVFLHMSRYDNGA